MSTAYDQLKANPIEVDLSTAVLTEEELEDYPDGAEDLTGKFIFCRQGTIGDPEDEYDKHNLYFALAPEMVDGPDDRGYHYISDTFYCGLYEKLSTLLSDLPKHILFGHECGSLSFDVMEGVHSIYTKDICSADEMWEIVRSRLSRSGATEKPIYGCEEDE